MSVHVPPYGHSASHFWRYRISSISNSGNGGTPNVWDFAWPLLFNTARSPSQQNPVVGSMSWTAAERCFRHRWSAHDGHNADAADFVAQEHIVWFIALILFIYSISKPINNDGGPEWGIRPRPRIIVHCSFLQYYLQCIYLSKEACLSITISQGFVLQGSFVFTIYQSV